jgi:hypothetical protein
MYLLPKLSHRSPDRCRHREAGAGSVRSSNPWVSEARFFDETTANGCLGDARKASPEIARKW